MSRNRSKTDCDCRFWSFGSTLDAEVPVGDPSLITQRQYFKAIDWEDCPYAETADYQHRSGGWGYRNDLSGKTFPYWRTPDNRCTSNSHWEPSPVSGQRFIFDPYTYSVVPPDERYRYRKLQCPICRRQYVGWYVQQPLVLPKEGEKAPPALYTLYDTSYWYAYNDEPGDRDKDGVIHWTQQQIVQALAEYLERHPQMRGMTKSDQQGRGR